MSNFAATIVSFDHIKSAFLQSWFDVIPENAWDLLHTNFEQGHPDLPFIVLDDLAVLGFHPKPNFGELSLYHLLSSMSFFNKVLQDVELPKPLVSKMKAAVATHFLAEHLPHISWASSYDFVTSLRPQNARNTDLSDEEYLRDDIVFESHLKSQTLSEIQFQMEQLLHQIISGIKESL